ncbi:MAG TPA: ADP-ribosylglycohydrolase family protein [Candidatus Tripitaka californicus]|uniref:ADP-ribosylglycohydrolase family protein n=1 Tax=Candidatus Tripitaka californicus TaxID=3367616 RepID=UPI004029D05B
MNEPIKDRFLGCLLGLAIGDALGMPFEGWSPASIKRQWRRGGFETRPYLPSPPRGLNPGQYTDDTLMALCHVHSLIEKGRVEPEDISQKFIEWYDSGNLRGIGATTAHAIRRLKKGRSYRAGALSPAWHESGATGEYAAGNGGTMRIAPVGLFYHNDLPALKEAVRKAVIITHNNPEAVAGALAVAYLVARSVREELHPDTAVREVSDFIGPGKVRENLQRAGGLLDSGATPEEALKTLGTSGYVVETVASAVFCFLYSPDDFYKTVVNAVEGGVDSDTTAAVAGAVSWSYNGTKGIPDDWLKGVEDSAGLQALAGRLYTAWRKK